MANFDALFAGCESFMEGDVEINNDVSVPSNAGESVEAESVAEDIGSEGSELAGDSETEEVKADAANMVFDHLLNMYRHVKNNGVDRTFLSLYNQNGQLNHMVGYRFPSCESIDVVGSPRSEASRAFIAAMESDGIWDKIWTWIKETWAKIVNFFRKVFSWFAEAFGNLDMRVGKLWKYFENSEDKKYDDIKTKTIHYFDSNNLTEVSNRLTKFHDELNACFKNTTLGVAGFTATHNVNGCVNSLCAASEKIAASFTQLSNNVADRAGQQSSGFGRSRDSDDKEGHKQLAQYIDKLNKDGLDPLEEAISDTGKESDTVEALSKGGKGSLSIKAFSTAGSATLTTTGNASGIKAIAQETLTYLKGELQYLLKLRQAMENMKRANEQAEARAEQIAQQNSGEMRSYEVTNQAKENTRAAIKIQSVLTRFIKVSEKYVAKSCKVVSSMSGCVTPK